MASLPERLVRKSRDLSLLRAREYDHVRERFERVEDGCVLYYEDAKRGRRFLGRYVKGALACAEFDRFKARLLDQARERESGTYIEQHDEVSRPVLARVAEEARAIPGFELRDVSDYSYFYNRPIYPHQDSAEYRLNTLFVVKAEDVRGLLVMSLFELYFDMEEGDLLIFNESEFHYVARNCPITQDSYRLAVNFHVL